MLAPSKELGENQQIDDKSVGVGRVPRGWARAVDSWSSVAERERLVIEANRSRTSGLKRWEKEP